MGFFILLSIVFHCLFSLVGYFLFKKIKYTKENFSKQQNIKYLLIAAFIIGILIAGSDEGNTGSIFTISFSIGMLISAIVGALISTAIIMRSKFALSNNVVLNYCLFGSIIFGYSIMMLSM
tara:strand:- start:788 stop:1150 length:363 start_codon:yes stop_codon:yes gene_type:complete